jgi:hypothetical protein
VIKNSTAVFVLGRKSGTSALMRVLNLLGVELGKLVVPGDSGDTTKENYKGFFEHKLVFYTHEVTFNLLGSFFNDIQELPKNWLLQCRRPSYDLENLIKRHFGEYSLWGVKSPRLCRLLPLWLGLTQKLEFIPVFVICVRNPKSVVKSFYRWYKIPENIGILLWTRYLIESELWTRGFKRVFVDFKDLIRSPEDTINKISTVLDLTFPKTFSSVKEEVEEFLDVDMIHFSEEIDIDLLDAPECIKSLHKNILSLPGEWNPEIYNEFLNNKREFLKLMSTPYYMSLSESWRASYSNKLKKEYQVEQKRN